MKGKSKVTKLMGMEDTKTQADINMKENGKIICPMGLEK